MQNTIVKRRASIIPLKTTKTILRIAKDDKLLKNQAFRLEFMATKGAEAVACLAGLLKEDKKILDGMLGYDFANYNAIFHILLEKVAKYTKATAKASCLADVEYARNVKDTWYSARWMDKASHDILSYCLACQILSKAQPTSFKFFGEFSKEEIDSIKDRLQDLIWTWQHTPSEYRTETKEMMLSTAGRLLQWK